MSKKKWLPLVFAASLLALSVSAPCMAESGPTGEPAERASSEGAAAGLEIRTYWLQDYDSDSYVSYGSGHYQVPGLNREAQSRWPELVPVMEDFSRQEGTDRTAAFEEACADSREARKDYDHEYEVSQETDIFPRRADDQVFSFVTYYMGYTGGAHGYYAYFGHNYDPVTGQELTLADVVSDEEALKDVIWDRLLEKYAGGSIGTMGATMDDYGSGEGKQPLNWAAGPDGLTFFFNPYELASYAEGAQTVTVGYEEFASLFTGRVSRQTGGAACRLAAWLEEDADVDGDGQFEKIGISEKRGDGMRIEGFTVRVNEEECGIDMGGNACVPYLMRAEDGRTCLYLEIQMDNDIRKTAVIDLTEGTPVLQEYLDAAVPERWEDLVTVTLFPVSTDCFRMSKRINLLSTYTGERNYTMSDGSTGEPLTEAWQADYAPSLTVVEELPVFPVDPDTGSVSESAVDVPAGEEVSVAATDGETWADLLLQDGSTARVYVDTSSWPHLIDGEDEAVYFEEQYYAG